MQLTNTNQAWLLVHHLGTGRYGDISRSLKPNITSEWWCNPPTRYDPKKVRSTAEDCRGQRYSSQTTWSPRQPVSESSQQVHSGLPSLALKTSQQLVFIALSKISFPEFIQRSGSHWGIYSAEIERKRCHLAFKIHLSSWNSDDLHDSARNCQKNHR